MTPFGNTLWATCKVFELALLLLIFRSKSHREWRWLVVYCILRLIIDAVGVYALKADKYPLFFYSFWAGEALISVAKVGILLTIYSFTFKSIQWAPRRVQVLLISAALLVIGVVSRSSVGSTSFASLLPEIAIASNRALAMGFAALLVLSIGLSAFLGIRWNFRYLLVDAGLCVSTCMSIIWYGLNRLHPHWHSTIRDAVDHSTYAITLILWICAFFITSPSRTFSPDLRTKKQSTIDALEQYIPVGRGD